MGLLRETPTPPSGHAGIYRGIIIGDNRDFDCADVLHKESDRQGVDHLRAKEVQTLD